MQLRRWTYHIPGFDISILEYDHKSAAKKAIKLAKEIYGEGATSDISLKNVADEQTVPSGGLGVVGFLVGIMFLVFLLHPYLKHLN